MMPARDISFWAKSLEEQKLKFSRQNCQYLKSHKKKKNVLENEEFYRQS